MTDPKPHPPELHELEEAPAAVFWEQGPVEQPSEPFPGFLPGGAVEAASAPIPAPPGRPAAPPPIPEPDPAFAAVVVDVVEDAVLEVDARDLERIVEPSGVDGDVVSLETLLATPPPAHAEALAPLFPPPLRRAPAAPPVEAGPAAPGAPFATGSFVAGDHRIVLHMAEGQVLRGSLANADLADPVLPLMQPNGAIARVPVEHVKAVFFMLPAGERPPASAGTRVRVTFSDGRQVSGLSPDYAPDSTGFFILPLDVRTHTSRVWVYRAAIQHLLIG